MELAPDTAILYENGEEREVGNLFGEGWRSYPDQTGQQNPS